MMKQQAGTPIFSLFVSSVEGKLVRRYGTSEHVGARRVTTRNASEISIQRGQRTIVTTTKPLWNGETEIVWDTETIVAIPEREHNRYRKEYERAFREGALVKRSREEWDAQTSAQKNAAKQAAEKPAEASTPGLTV